MDDKKDAKEEYVAKLLAIAQIQEEVDNAMTNPDFIATKEKYAIANLKKGLAENRALIRFQSLELVNDCISARAAHKGLAGVNDADIIFKFAPMGLATRHDKRQPVIYSENKPHIENQPDA